MRRNMGIRTRDVSNAMVEFRMPEKAASAGVISTKRPPTDTWYQQEAAVPQCNSIPSSLVPIENQCSIEGCEKRVYAREWCAMHWKRNQRHGSPHTVWKESKAFNKPHLPRNRVNGNLVLCRVCEKWLPRSEFDRKRSSEIGVTYRCRPCRRAWDSQQTAAKAARHLQRQREKYKVCWYCGVELTDDTRTIDHVVPKSSGGSNARSNLVAACKHCNSSKRTKTLEEFRKLRARQRDGVPYFYPNQVEYLEKMGVALPEGEPYVFHGEREAQ